MSIKIQLLTFYSKNVNIMISIMYVVDCTHKRKDTNMNKANSKKRIFSRQGKLLILGILILAVLVTIIVMGIASSKKSSSSDSSSQPLEIELTTEAETVIPDGVQYKVSYEEVNLRKDPQIADDNIIGQLYNDDVLYVDTNISRCVGDYRWVYVTDSKLGVGWIVTEAIYR